MLLCLLTRLHFIEVRLDYEKDVTGLKVVLPEKSGVTKVFGLLTTLQRKKMTKSLQHNQNLNFSR